MEEAIQSLNSDNNNINNNHNNNNNRRLRWAGHVARMEEGRSAFKSFNRYKKEIFREA